MRGGKRGRSSERGRGRVIASERGEARVMSERGRGRVISDRGA